MDKTISSQMKSMKNTIMQFHILIDVVSVEGTCIKNITECLVSAAACNYVRYMLLFIISICVYLPVDRFSDTSDSAELD